MSPDSKDIDKHLKHIVTHVFLPPKLPRQSDSSRSANSAILSLVHEVACTYRSHDVCPSDQWNTAKDMLSKMKFLHDKDDNFVLEFTSSLQNMKSGSVISLHIEAQNAGIIMRQTEDEVAFELFEVSAKSSNVIECRGRLLSTFPGPTHSIPIAIAKDLSFSTSLGEFLETMSKESISEASEISQKAGKDFPETRDTPSPRFITELLGGILRGQGRQSQPKRICKRIRDDVLHGDGNVPWRRSPLWLVVRVALQSTLYCEDNKLQPNLEYKLFMLAVMVRITKVALKNGFPSDELSVMCKKLSRRANKLGDSCFQPGLLAEIDKTITAVSAELDRRWETTRKSCVRSLGWDAQKLSFERDTEVKLLQSKRYIEDRIVAMQATIQAPSSSYTPQEHPRIRKSACLPDFDIALSGSKDEFHRFVVLVDFEHWVKNNLKNWQSSTQNNMDKLKVLSRRFHSYWSAASETYRGQVDCVSTMILTLMEIWMAIDITACYRIDLLERYSPEVPQRFLEPLVLAKFEDMERLQTVEDYIESRHIAAAKWNFPSVFAQDPFNNSFAIRYFDTSTALQSLEFTIILQAKDEQDTKWKELDRLNKNHRELMRQFYDTPHNNSLSHRRNLYHDPRRCVKCQYEASANSLSIQVFEWPLPKDTLEKKNALFELNPPEEFVIWRDLTYELLLNIAETAKETESVSETYGFENYPILKARATHCCRRIALASQAKPVHVSHYGSSVSIPSTKDRVSVPNGLHYKLFDTVDHEWANGRIENCSLSDACSTILPDGHYKSLQFSLNSTNHTTNDVISNQEDCSPGLTLHEFEAFGSLRAGFRLQWRNMLRELVTGTLKFRHEEVFILFHRAANQAECVSLLDTLREAHIDLRDIEFGKSLLDELFKILCSIQDNWEERTTLKTIIMLACRLLCCTNSKFIRREAQRFLVLSRKIALGWTRKVVLKLREVEDVEETSSWQHHVLQLAALCRSTFNIDDIHLSDIFLSESACQSFVECGIYIHENYSSTTSDLSPPLEQMLQSDKVLTIRLESSLLRALELDVKDLDNALLAIWPSYRPGSQWQHFGSPNERWWCSETAAESPEEKSLKVHVNVLEGRILVNGNPFGRMPDSYINHPTFQRIFQGKILDASPSPFSGSGMVYQSRLQIKEHTLHFALVDGELIIRAEKAAVILELIPHIRIKEDICVPLIEGHSHWLCPKLRQVEFRSLDNWWHSKPENWVLKCPLGAKFGIARHSRQHSLLDLQSEGMKMIAKTLDPLEARSEILAYFDDTKNVHQTFVCLPRYKLNFFLNESGCLESLDFRDSIVDENQDIGTFYGLRNLLVFRKNCKTYSNRSFLVPDGKVTTKTEKNHVRVVVDGGTGRTLLYNHFTVDKMLGRLLDDTSMKGRYLKLYLHALTANCCPDPLTGRTGTEEALEGLCSQASFSFPSLDLSEIQLLEAIAQLTPSRQYYPEHLHTMQVVRWSSHLPWSNQHDLFYTFVKKIWEHWKSIASFNQDCPQLIITFKDKCPLLLERARIRHMYSSKPPSSFGDKLADFDSTYLSRQEDISLRENRVCEISDVVARWPSKTNVASDLKQLFSFCKSLSGPNEERKLRYEHDWLNAEMYDVWCTLYNTCRKTTKSERFHLLFILAACAYQGKVDQSILKTFVGFATNPAFKSINIPRYENFSLDRGCEPVYKHLYTCVSNSGKAFDRTRENDLSQLLLETNYNYEERQQLQHRSRVESEVTEIVKHMISRWRCKDAGIPNRQYSHVNVHGLQRKASNLFKDWYANWEFYQFVDQVKAILQNMRSHDPQIDSYCKVIAVYPTRPEPKSIVTRWHLSLRKAPKLLAQEHMCTFDTKFDSEDTKSEIALPEQFEKLDFLIEKVSNVEQAFGKRYISDLKESMCALKKRGSKTQPNLGLPSIILLEKKRGELEDTVANMFQALVESLKPEDTCEEMLQKSGLWPSCTTITMLEVLQSKHRMFLKLEWKEAILNFGCAISYVQQLNRLLVYALNENAFEFFREAQTIARSECYALQPDWLLIELQSDIRIRPIQAKIASQMIGPSSDANTVLQLNMGEGKSSVIIPMVSTALADGKKLARVLVLKPLGAQMFHLLRQKLSDLCNRRIYYLPFSRALKTDSGEVRQILELYKECMDNDGILLALPEHVLSFKLMGLDKLISGQKDLANSLIEGQKWLDCHARDILDESDEILDVRYQLVYTVGTQQALEGSPDRWVIAQQLFDLVKDHSKKVSNEIPHSMDIGEHVEATFPFTRILREEAGVGMIDLIVQDICSGVLQSISFRLLSSEMMDMVKRFLIDETVTQNEKEHLLNECPHLRFPLLLLRGLLCGPNPILIFVLKEKRYRVDYGLDVSRSKLAVPYRGKDVPATKAEYGHPEVAILLTCLSYYYKGLTNDQIHICFEHLWKQENPEGLYGSWVKPYTNLPESLRKLRGVNLQDRTQCEEAIFPLLQKNKIVIDFYLSELVFPKEAKEFPHKLSTSGWDIAETKANVTTGFSGTNDNRYLLPTSIEQHETPEHIHTNAMVLDYLLREENSHCVYARTKDASRLGIPCLLKLVIQQKPRLKVLLDVGAQVLELSNIEVVQLWMDLDCDPDIEGAVYFDDNDRIMILRRTGRSEPFHTSALSTQLEKCFVYLDESHTRGTDLKLPVGTRAVVTLGPKLCKDKLVQGCMRMRKLANGHSLVFFIPPEVYQLINSVCQKSDKDTIETSDILHWAMSETCSQTMNNLPAWAHQGLQYSDRYEGWRRYRADKQLDALEETMMERESRTVMELYGIKNRDQTSMRILQNQSINNKMTQSIFQTCSEFGICSFNDVGMQEEQEREVSHEIEREHQIERPPKVEAHIPSLHDDLYRLVRIGILQSQSRAFSKAFQLFSQSTLRDQWSIHDAAWTQSPLLVTSDFAQTIQMRPFDSLNNYLRPVHWILSLKSNPDVLILLSPFEVQELMPSIRKYEYVHLHTYAPRTLQSMGCLDDLELCVIPPLSQRWRGPSSLTVMELNLFAGQLFFRDWKEYIKFCDFFGLLTDTTSTDFSTRDGFLNAQDRKISGIHSKIATPFSVSPSEVLYTMISIRRKGQNFSLSHVGNVLRARLLTEKDF